MRRQEQHLQGVKERLACPERGDHMEAAGALDLAPNDIITPFSTSISYRTAPFPTHTYMHDPHHMQALQALLCGRPDIVWPAPEHALVRTDIGGY